MKAIKVIDQKPVLADAPTPVGDGVRVRVVSSSICGSDLSLMAMGAFGDHIIGHEFAGITDNGTAVAIEPITGCQSCAYCVAGHRVHCESGIYLMGVLGDGGMAEFVQAPEHCLVELPTGLEVRIACLAEPLSVAIHGLDRARVRDGDRVLIIGAGPIGLATVAALQHRGIACDIAAKYEHQKVAAERFGAGLAPTGTYDVVIDAVGNSASMAQSVEATKPRGRIGLVGVSWDTIGIEMAYSRKEIELIPSMGYSFKAPNRTFEEAGQLLLANPDVADLMVTHRFPLEGVSEAFAQAKDRSGGAIKVAFDVS